MVRHADMEMTVRKEVFVFIAHNSLETGPLGEAPGPIRRQRK